MAERRSSDVTSASPAETGVLIVGAGPTGLTLAIELARRNVPFRLIDKAPARPTSSRAIGTQVRTAEVFRLMGIPESALAPTARPRAIRMLEGSHTLAEVAFAERPGAPRLIIMDESDTERMLERRLAELGGQSDAGVELLNFEVADEHIVATLRDASGASLLRARYLVGADGAHSIVRQRAGIAFVGSAYPERFLLADLDLDWDFPHDEAYVWIGDRGQVAILPLPGERRFRLIIPLSLAESGAEFTSESQIADMAEAIVRQRTGVHLRRIGEPIWASAFHISRRQAERYREGPVFLAGDAAHVHSPVGGQGMNTGIQDAFNLGWKLALAVNGMAAPGLLDTYQAERHPVARSVLRGTDLGTRLVLSSQPLVRSLRERLVPALAHVPAVRRRLLMALSQVNVRYRRSFLSVDADDTRGGWDMLRDRHALQAGDRIPDSDLLDSTGKPVAMFDLISRGWVLLLLAGEPPAAERLAALQARASEVAESVGEMVQSRLLVTTPPEGALAIPIVLDPVGELHRLFAAQGGLVAVIRPDGYLGYRGLPEQSGELASYLARVFAMRLR